MSRIFRRIKKKKNKAKDQQDHVTEAHSCLIWLRTEVWPGTAEGDKTEQHVWWSVSEAFECQADEFELDKQTLVSPLGGLD